MVLPRPNAGWKKVQCILRFMVRLNRVRRRARGEDVPDGTVPGLTNAMRAIIVTRCLGIRYEGEEDPFDTRESRHSRLLAGPSFRGLRGVLSSDPGRPSWSSRCTMA